MILFACPLMFLLLPLPFLVRRFLPPVKGLHGDALRVPFLRDIAPPAGKKLLPRFGGCVWSGFF